MKINLKYLGAGRFQAASEFDAHIADNNLNAGDILCMTPHEKRSMAQHRWLFAVIQKAFNTLPDNQIDRFPSVDHLRKYALIRAGWCDVRTRVFDSAEIAHLAAGAFKVGNNLITDGRNFTITLVKDNVVDYVSARSMSIKACKGPNWEAVCVGVVDFLSELLGCDVTQLLDDINDVPEWVNAPDQ